MEVEINNREIITILASNISSWRVKNHLSKRKLSKVCLLAESSIRNVESGSKNTELRTLVKLRLGFSVMLCDLFEVNSSSVKIRTSPLDFKEFERAFAEEKASIGKRLVALQEFRQLNSETLSLLSHNIDYSDTLKYQRGEENLELLTLLKYADGLEVDLTDILNYSRKFPNTKFKGKMKD